jgi:hypothetical protein
MNNLKRVLPSFVAILIFLMPFSIWAGDFNDDGTDDLVWLNNTNGGVAIWLLGVECSPKIGPFDMLGFPQPEEARHEEETVHRRTDYPDFAGCGSEDD